MPVVCSPKIRGRGRVEFLLMRSVNCQFDRFRTAGGKDSRGVEGQ